MMKTVLLCGSGGFLEKELLKSLREEGYTVSVMHDTDILTDDNLVPRVDGKDIVINMCGRTFLKPYSVSNAKLAYDTRVEVSTLLAEAVSLSEKPPSVFISRSTVAIYSSDSKTVHIESSPSFGQNSFSSICVDWESPILRLEDETRVIILRMGHIIARQMGIMKRSIKKIRWGLGAYNKPGTQWFPWVHYEDVISAILFVINNDEISGGVNVVAPKHIKQRMFFKLCANLMNSFMLFSVPEWVNRARYGQFSKEIVSGAKVFPGILKQSGFSFKYSDPKDALLSILGKRR